MDNTTRKRIADMWNSGMTAAAIGKELHMPANTIIGIVYRLRNGTSGLITRKPDMSKARQRKVPSQQKIANAAKVVPSLGSISPYIAKLDTYGEHKPIFLVGPNKCKWPVDHTGHEYLFCCANADGSSYCPEHAAKAYTKASYR